MTDVPNQGRVIVVIARIRNSDLPSPSAVISIAQAVPNVYVSMKVFVKHHVNWNTDFGAIQNMPHRNIWCADIVVEVLNEHDFTLSYKQDHPCTQQG